MTKPGALTKETLDYIEKWRLDALIPVTARQETGINHTVTPENIGQPDEKPPFQPDWEDLCRLHAVIIERRVTTVLEFGVGYSSLIFAHAVAANRQAHGGYVAANLRRNDAFTVHSLDDIPHYLEMARARLPAGLAEIGHFHCAPVRMGEFAGRICTFYDRLPNICPDFIYLDGPSQTTTLGEVAGITTNHPDRLPMAADILRIEHFLLPGTLIMVDGRTANARFLRTNLQRGWEYAFFPAEDVHTFELVEPPLGRYNERQIRYCLGDGWLEKAGAGSEGSAGDGR